MWKLAANEAPPTQLNNMGYRESRYYPLIISYTKPNQGEEIQPTFVRGYYFIAVDGYRRWIVEGVETTDMNVVAWYDLPEFTYIN